MRSLGILLLGGILALVGVLLGVWWWPFVIGIGIGIAEPRGRTAVPLGAAVGLLSWLIPLAEEHQRYGLGPTVSSLAAIMGFGHEAFVPVVITLVVATLLGVCGAWLATAIRGLVPARAR